MVRAHSVAEVFLIYILKPVLYVSEPTVLGGNDLVPTGHLTMCGSIFQGYA